MARGATHGLFQRGGVSALSRFEQGARFGLPAIGIAAGRFAGGHGGEHFHEPAGHAWHEILGAGNWAGGYALA